MWDLVFWVLLIMLIIPSTRAVIFSGMAKARALVMPLKVNAVPDEPAADTLQWIMLTPDEEMAALADARGEVILVNLWATWCPPCRAEMPDLQRLYERMGDRVKFYMVTNEESAVVNSWIEKKGYTFPVYMAGHAAPPELASSSIPATFIIDRQGHVVLSKRGAYNWNSFKVRRLLEKLLDEPR